MNSSGKHWISQEIRFKEIFTNITGIHKNTHEYPRFEGYAFKEIL